jgi:hypothetical protein
VRSVGSSQQQQRRQRQRDKTAVISTLSAVRVIAASPMPVRGLTLIPANTHLLSASDDKTAKPGTWRTGQ